jgi:hypothetical protein
MLKENDELTRINLYYSTALPGAGGETDTAKLTSYQY